MTLPTSPFYDQEIAALHDVLLRHAITQTFLSCSDVVYMGRSLAATTQVESTFGTFLGIEFAHLLMIFDGSRVHAQNQNTVTLDLAPSGTYFTIVNGRQTLQPRHKNRIGVYRLENKASLFVDALHIDHFFLNEKVTPVGLGAIAFCLCAINSHLAGFGQITLVAAGGIDANPSHVGYKVWPKLGFDAVFESDDVRMLPEHLAECRTVRMLIEKNEAWWEENGFQLLMTFDLSADSASWRMLLAYMREKFVERAQS